MSLLDNLETVPADVRQLAGEWPLCFEFKLPKGSTVIIAGAYKGKLMELISRLYPGVTIHGFEPQLWAIEKAYERNLPMGGERGASFLHPYGIGDSEGQLEMGEFETDAASFINVGTRKQGFGQIREFGSVMSEHDIERIDLAIFNMEGYEFVLLPYLLSQNWLEKIDRLAIQWHINIGAGSIEDVNAILDKTLQHGHHIVYDHRPQWTYTENWASWEARKKA